MPSSEITSGKAPMRKRIWNRLDALKNPDEYNQIYDSALPNIGSQRQGRCQTPFGKGAERKSPCKEEQCEGERPKENGSN